MYIPDVGNDGRVGCHSGLNGSSQPAKGVTNSSPADSHELSPLVRGHDQTEVTLQSRSVYGEDSNQGKGRGEGIPQHSSFVHLYLSCAHVSHRVSEMVTRNPEGWLILDRLLVESVSRDLSTGRQDGRRPTGTLDPFIEGRAVTLRTDLTPPERNRGTGTRRSRLRLKKIPETVGPPRTLIP